MDIPPKFVSKNIEKKWYSYWMENEFFSSTPDERDPYTLVIPPPNVTGVLHMGHMLNNTLQDIIIRRARMQGYNACWVPGTDHASIATEAKVVAKLKEQGIDKSDLSREEFLKHAWDWTLEYGGVILEQLKKIGCSCDWNRTKFTLDEQMSASVIATFIKLFNQGLITGVIEWSTGIQRPRQPYLMRRLYTRSETVNCITLPIKLWIVTKKL